MRKFRKFRFLLYCIVLYLSVITGVQAQEAVAPNGKFVTVKGLKIYYEETGQGEPLILLHGFNKTASEWAPFIPELAKSYRVITMDLLGHGRSDYLDTADVYLFRNSADYTIGALQVLKIDSAYFMGVSAGAITSMYISLQKPQLAKKLIIIGGQVYNSTTTRNFLTALGPKTENTKEMEALIKLHGKKKAYILARQFWNLRKVNYNPSFTPDILSSILSSVFIIHGDNDPIAPVSQAWEMFLHIPGASLWVVPNGGHVPMLQPGNQDDFLRRVLEFLRGNFKKR